MPAGTYEFNFPYVIQGVTVAEIDARADYEVLSGEITKIAKVEVEGYGQAKKRWVAADLELTGRAWAYLWAHCVDAILEAAHENRPAIAPPGLAAE